MGRRAHNFKISSSSFGSVIAEVKPSLREQIKNIAKEKGVSVHTLVEIYLERCVNDYLAKGF